MTREERAKAYARTVPIPFAPDEVTKVILDGLEQAYLAGAKDADSHPAWRMCEDELPEESEWVLVAYNDAYGIGYGVANHFDNHWNTADDNLKIEGIVAWLHLPKFNDKESE